MATTDLTAAFLRTQFSYDLLTGVFVRIGESKPSGRIATKGYRQIWIAPRRHMAHRLAWLYVYGEWPLDQLDHINQVKDDNRIANLRIVDNKQNQENVSMWSHNTTGRRGVSWNSAKCCFQSDIKHHKKTIALGRYDNIIDAVAARMKAERELFTHAPVTH